MPSRVESLQRLVLAGHLARQRPHALESLLAIHRSLGDEPRARLAAQSATLAVLLEREGHHADAPLLLELACLEPGHSRGKPGSIQRIWFEEAGQPSRHLREAADWWKRCMRHVAEVRRLTPREHTRVDPEFARAVAPPADALTVLCALARHPASSHPGEEAGALAQRFRQLGPEEGRAMARFALELLKRGTEGLRSVASEVLELLACLTPGAIEGLHSELLAHGISAPGFLFLGAGPDIREHLVRRLDAPGPASRGEADALLKALAWIGDAEVQRAFTRWRESPPPWAGILHVPPHTYAHEAGWELTAEGARRELHVSGCHVLSVPPDGMGTDGSPVQVVTPLTARCGGCGGPLVALLELDLTQPELAFLDLPGERLCLAMCERCTYFGTTFTQVDTRGGVKWNPRSTGHSRDTADDEDTPLPQRRLALGARRTLALEAHVAWSRVGAGCVSQLGGLPNWITGSDYAACPGCSRSMRFVGQVQLSELGEAPEGTVYALLCAECGFAATTYQQT